VPDRDLAGWTPRDLLVVFDVAMRERCMHRSAVRLGLTELDLRGALARLDATLGEPLFTILGNRLMPTVRARRLADARREEAGETRSDSGH
jgi:DNA-binding transcriptional LysR family regulator